MEIWPDYAMKLFSAMLFRSSKLRQITSHSSMKTLDHMLRVLYETAWHSRMLMCYHGQRFHPIFHPLSIWDDMERQLRHLQNQPLTLSEMGPALIRIWNKIPQEFFNTLIRSMRLRCQACMINANGGHIRYWLC